MTADVVIRAEKLGKKYLIGHQAAERTTTLRDAITRSTRQWARSVRDITKGAANIAGDEIEEFWALRDVSFDIHRGDVVGVIGRNGAGKSTLLKVLSRITEPSEGRVEIRGRIASLLEVGTGFHPELSGRENIYLNGAVLGMSQAEVKRKFDEIVAFAEIEKFLDTPVKRYSSGMYVRLAFAVAAHLEPEILIVDEVLAVGDAEFQKKCLGKMQDVAGHGRTVLFVSHHMGSINGLCQKAAYLVGGRLRFMGPVKEAISQYTTLASKGINASGRVIARDLRSRSESDDIQFLSFAIENNEGTAQSEISFKAPFAVRFSFRCRKPVRDVFAGFSFIAADGREIMGSSAHDLDTQLDISAGDYEAVVRINPNILTPGTYGLRAAIFRSSFLYHHIDEVMTLSIIDAFNRSDHSVQRHLVGDVHLSYPWTIHKIAPISIENV